VEKQAVDNEIQAVVDQVPTWRGKALILTPLDGGLTNRNYRVDAEGVSYVLRLAGVNTDLLGIDREREMACSRTAAGVDVGPEVITYLPEYQALVRRFVQGKQLTEADVRRPEVLRRLAQTLRRCHACKTPSDLGTFLPFEAVRNYYALAQQRTLPLPQELSQALDLLARLETELRTGEPPCLCHNDLLPANFIDDGTCIRIIDWEYGGLGDRFFDLGNLAVNNVLDEGQERLLLEAYFGEARPEDLRRLRLMRLVSDMREAMWGFLQAGISTLHSPEYYLAYGRKHLERFLGAAAAHHPPPC
jgi:thiamine kinase-like enzyme